MKSEEVSAEVPATRTVDLEGNKPWQWAKPELIEEWQQKGEVVYLWEDAEGIELLLQSGIDSDPEGYKVKSKYVQLFVNELLEQSPEKEPYLNALSESAASLADGDIESAKIKLDEAKQLRLQ